MLSQEQLELRQRGVGASEIAAILGASPWRTPLDVWATKRRGRDGELPPLQDPEPEPDTPSAFAPLVEGEPRFAGSVLEDGIVSLYEHRTGARVRRTGTRVHPDKPWALATPDRLVDPLDGEKKGGRVFHRGLECKLVGFWVAKLWPDDEPPEYVWTQVQWGMGVLDFEEWDVAALLGGNTFKTFRVVRDDDFLRDTFEVVEDWWFRHVVGDEPPDPLNADDLRRHLARRYPEDNGAQLEVDDDHPAAPLMRQLAKVKRAEKNLKKLDDELTAQLVELCGHHRSINLDGFGRFACFNMRGGVKWKELAEHLNDGQPIADDVLEHFRGNSYRKPQLYPKKAKKKR